jgi:predicted deacylase
MRRVDDVDKGARIQKIAISLGLILMPVETILAQDPPTVEFVCPGPALELFSKTSSIVWVARDPNPEQTQTLVLKIEARTLDGEFQTVADRVPNAAGFFPWNTREFPDGVAVLRIQATDSTGLSSPQVESGRFIIDNGEAIEEELYRRLGASDPSQPTSVYRPVQRVKTRLEELARVQGHLLDLGPGELGRVRVFALKISDPDSSQTEGQEVRERQIVIVGGIHAREWIATECALRLAEHLIENPAGDPEIRRLVADTEIFVIPSANPEGLEFTQRYWNQALVYPTYARILHLAGDQLLHASRDGRWRRKNRRDAEDDELLNPVRLNLATQDALLGVDLNRNFGGLADFETDHGDSSPCQTSLDYRGSGEFSEAETRALRRLFTSGQIRRNDFLGYLDFHSNAQEIRWTTEVPDTLPRYGEIVATLGSEMLDLLNKGTFLYGENPNPGLRGSLRRFVAREFRVPAILIELPKDPGTNNFIVPEEEVASIYEAVREAALHQIGWTLGPAAAEFVEIRSNGGYRARWANTGAATRELVVERHEAISAGRHTIEIRFDRPMRTTDGQGRHLDPEVTWDVRPPFTRFKAIGPGQWSSKEIKDDTWTGTIFIAPVPGGEQLCPVLRPLQGGGGKPAQSGGRLRIRAQDAWGNELDGGPSTIPAWEGRWTAYEDESGIDTFRGGADIQHCFAIEEKKR